MYDSVIPDAVLSLMRQCSNTSGVQLLKWGRALGASANTSATGVPSAVEALTRELCRLRHGELAGADCLRRDYVGDVFFFSCLLFAGTFCFSYGFKLLRNSSFFTGLVRCSPLLLSLSLNSYLKLQSSAAHIAYTCTSITICIRRCAS